MRANYFVFICIADQNVNIVNLQCLYFSISQNNNQRQGVWELQFFNILSKKVHKKHWGVMSWQLYNAIKHDQLIQFNLNMNYNQESISIYLAEDCKQCNKVFQKSMENEFVCQGRWSSQQWYYYVQFSLQEICANDSSNPNNYSFAIGRRAYRSFDRRFVQFLKNIGEIPDISQDQQKRLVKRVKSKFNTLKRRYRETSKSNRANKIQIPDFNQYIVQEAEKILQKRQSKQLRGLIENYKKRKRQVTAPKSHKGQKTQFGTKMGSQQRVKTRSLIYKQKNIGIQNN